MISEFMSAWCGKGGGDKQFYECLDLRLKGFNDSLGVQRRGGDRSVRLYIYKTIFESKG